MFTIHTKTCCNITEAFAKCRQIGGTLARFKTAEDQRKINDKITEIKNQGKGAEWIDMSDGDHKDLFYIALRRNSSNTWKWSDGTDLKDQESNSNWFRGDEPNNVGGDENCVGFGSKTNAFGKWWDVKCTWKNKFVCESGEL